MPKGPEFHNELSPHDLGEHPFTHRLPENAVVTGIDGAPSPEGVRVGVYGASRVNTGVWAHSETGVGLFARGGELAARLDGNAELGGNVAIAGNADIAGSVAIKGDLTKVGHIRVSGDVELANADCAEDFDVACSAAVEPGTVVALDADGRLQPSSRAYDRRVVGVISGAGTYRPALVLDRQVTGDDRMPVALMGKVYCKVDADHGAVEIGDLLTSSPTAGHAMKAGDPSRAFGSIVGKALRPLREGRQLIPILIARQ